MAENSPRITSRISSHNLTASTESQNSPQQRYSHGYQPSQSEMDDMSRRMTFGSPELNELPPPSAYDMQSISFSLENNISLSSSISASDVAMENAVLQETCLEKEVCLLFPTYGYKRSIMVPQDLVQASSTMGAWSIFVHGWLYAPKAASRTRRVTTGIMGRYLGLNKAREERDVFEERIQMFFLNNLANRRIVARFIDDTRIVPHKVCDFFSTMGNSSPTDKSGIATGAASNDFPSSCSAPPCNDQTGIYTQGTIQVTEPMASPDFSNDIKDTKPRAKFHRRWKSSVSNLFRMNHSRNREGTAKTSHTVSESMSTLPSLSKLQDGGGSNSDRSLKPTSFPGNGRRPSGKIFSPNDTPVSMRCQSGELSLCSTSSFLSENGLLVNMTSDGCGHFFGNVSFDRISSCEDVKNKNGDFPFFFEKDARFASMENSSDRVSLDIRSFSSATLSWHRHPIAVCHLIPPTGVTIVSDIDDTIKHSHVKQGLKKLLTATLVHGSIAVEGMSDLYQLWSQKSSTSIHYVSNAPWQLYPMIALFLKTHGFPEGSVHMKQLASNPQTSTSKSLWRHARGNDVVFNKLSQIFGLMRDFPWRKFFLVGDSGEYDAAIYAQVAQKHPSQVRGIFIRDITSPILRERQMRCLDKFLAKREKVHFHKRKYTRESIRARLYNDCLLDDEEKAIKQVLLQFDKQIEAFHGRMRDIFRDVEPHVWRLFEEPEELKGVMSDVAYQE